MSPSTSQPPRVPMSSAPTKPTTRYPRCGVRWAACSRATASASVPDDQDRPADQPGAAQLVEHPPGDRPLDRSSAATTKTRIDTIQNRDSALNWKTNETATTTPIADRARRDDPPHLLGRRARPPGPGTACSARTTTIQAGNVTKARTRCERWTPRWSAGAHQRLPPERQRDGHADDEDVSGDQALLQRPPARRGPVRSSGSTIGGATSTVARPPVMLPAVFNSARPRFAC